MLIQLLNLDFFWTDITFQLFDFVIKNEFELFKLLNFLVQLLDLDVLFFNCVDPRSVLLLASMDVGLDLLLLNHFNFKLVFLFLQIFCFIATL